MIWNQEFNYLFFENPSPQINWNSFPLKQKNVLTQGFWIILELT